MSISIFNNNGDGTNDNGPTVGLELSLSLPPNPSSPPVVLEHLEVPSDEIYVKSQGSYTPLTNNEGTITTQFMGYGQIPRMREYGSAVDGSDLRWEARFGPDGKVQNYRAFKQPWNSVPKQAPKLVCDGGTAYVSWNGATGVSAWEVYAGSSKNQLNFVGEAPFAGFETKFGVNGTCVQVVPKEHQNTKSNVACIEHAV